jgi:hypothetical protein
MSTRRLLAALAATLLVLTGCSSDDGGEAVRTVDETSTTAPQEQTPAELVREAAQAPSQHETVTMEMVVEMDGEQIMRTAGTTSVDNVRGDMVSESGGVEFRMLLVDGDYFFQYASMPPGYEWVGVPAAEVTQMSGVDPTASGADPTSMLAMLEQVSGELEPLGTEELFGVTVQGYRASVSRDAVLKSNAMAGVFDEDFVGDAMELLPETYEMDVWIDGDGLPRRQVWSLELPLGIGDTTSTFDYRMDFSEWGAPLEVSRPHPGVVISMQEFMAAAAGR